MTASFDVRTATHADVPQIMEWGRAFHAYSPWARDEFDAEAVRAAVTGLIDGEDRVILIHEHGMLGGLIGPVWTSPHVRMAQEAFWWADKGGKALLDAFEEWARQSGAKYVTMLSLPDEKAERMRQLYARAGYAPSESAFLKEV